MSGQYAPDTCSYCGADTWCSPSGKTGKPMCRGCRAVLFYEGLYRPIKFTALPWQERDIRSLYGTVRPEDGTRQYRRGYISVAKKNGKSFEVGGLPLLHLCLEPDLETRPLEAYGAAAAKDQANIVFRAAAELVDANPALKSVLRIIASQKRIIRRDGRGFYQVISSEGGIWDGIEPSLFIKDEVHRWKTQACAILQDVGDKGTISRNEPLSIGLTTRGEEYECPLWEKEDERAQRVLDGTIIDPTFYVDIHCADAKRIQTEPDYWMSREARVAANPSHEDNGGFLKDEAIVLELNKALEDPTEKPKYIRYHLNVMSNAREQRVIDMDVWRDQERFGVDLREWPEYDVELLIRKWDLLDKPCWLGVDLAATVDLTAVTLVFPPFDDDEVWTWVGFAWMAEGQVKIREKADKVTYSDWARRGFLETTPGMEIDNRAIKDRIRWAGEMFDLRTVCFDPYNAREVRSTLTDEGFTTAEIKQTVTQLNEATRRFLGLVANRNIRHGNNPLMNFAASCLSTVSDTNDLIRPKKPDRVKSSKRIDPMAAGITAMYQPVAGEMERSVYEDRGVFMLGGSE